jgi:hypothetical protein
MNLPFLGGNQDFLSQAKRWEMCEYIKEISKQYIVEETESLGTKELLQLIELFRDDAEFKKFLAISLKDKIIQTPNLPSRELMTAIVEILDIEEVRGEIIRYALNSEVFYAFSVSYMISLLKRISQVHPF